MTEKKFTLVFSTNLKRYLEQYNMTQKELAKRLGVGTSSVSSWVTGQKSPRMDKVDAMCEIFHCKRSDLMEDNSKSKKPAYKTVKIPVLGTVPCGEPIEAIQDILDWVEVPEDMNRDGLLYALRAKGDSMASRILEGDTLIIHQQPDAESGQVVIALVNGDEATCKELRKRKDGIMLVPWNNIGYDPQFYTWKDVEQLPVRIIGKLVEIRAKPFKG